MFSCLNNKGDNWSLCNEREDFASFVVFLLKTCGPLTGQHPLSHTLPPSPPAAGLLGRCEILIASLGNWAHCLSHLTEISFSAANIITGGLDFKNSLSPVC